MYVSDDRVPQLGEGWLDTVINTVSSVAKAGAQVVSAVTGSKTPTTTTKTTTTTTAPKPATSSAGTIAGVGIGTLLVAGAVGYLLLRKK